MHFTLLIGFARIPGSSPGQLPPLTLFAAAGDFSRQRSLSAGVDRSRHIGYCILVKFTTYFILMGCGKLRTVVYFQKIIRQQKS